MPLLPEITAGGQKPTGRANDDRLRVPTIQDNQIWPDGGHGAKSAFAHPAHIAVQRGASASAPREFAPTNECPCELCRSYFSFRRMDVVVVQAKADQHGVETERALEIRHDRDPRRRNHIGTVSLPHSSVNARLAAASGFICQSSAMAGALEWSFGRAVFRQPRGHVIARLFPDLAEALAPPPSRNETLAEASAGITVLEPSPV